MGSKSELHSTGSRIPSPDESSESHGNTTISSPEESSICSPSITDASSSAIALIVHPAPTLSLAATLSDLRQHLERNGEMQHLLQQSIWSIFQRIPASATPCSVRRFWAILSQQASRSFHPPRRTRSTTLRFHDQELIATSITVVAYLIEVLEGIVAAAEEGNEILRKLEEREKVSDKKGKGKRVIKAVQRVVGRREKESGREKWEEMVEAAMGKLVKEGERAEVLRRRAEEFVMRAVKNAEMKNGVI